MCTSRDVEKEGWLMKLAVKSLKRVHGVLSILVLCAVCSGQNTPNAVAASSSMVSGTNGEAVSRIRPALPDDYRIGNSDVLMVNVWHEAEISREVPVRPDGRISLPLIGDVQAKGLTAAELQAGIAQQLKSFIENPAVTVIVQQPKSRHFSVMGEVNRPGTYVLDQPMTVLDGLALSGGFHDFAKLKKIYVLRTGPDGSQQRIPFNYKRVIAGKKSSQNVPLESGDMIVVP
jgi:polysaccharide export outer membrane protein